MKKIVLSIVLIVSSLSIYFYAQANSIDVFSLNSPPKLQFNTAHQTYDLVTGSYCWGNRCSDKDLVSSSFPNNAPIQVKVGQTLTVINPFKAKASARINFKNASTSTYLFEMDQDVEALTFTAPSEAGTYYGLASVHWEKTNNKVGSSYYFYIEVIE